MLMTVRREIAGFLPDSPLTFLTPQTGEC
jgi:hypothetical protein